MKTLYNGLKFVIPAENLLAYEFGAKAKNKEIARAFTTTLSNLLKDADYIYTDSKIRQWVGSHYAEVSDGNFNREILYPYVRTLEEKYKFFGEKKLQDSMKDDVLRALEPAGNEVENTTDRVLINCFSGVIEVKDGHLELLPHNKRYLHTSLVKAHYNVSGGKPESPILDKFLRDTALTEAELNLFFDYVGAAYIPHSVIKNEHILILRGEQGSGKSTFLDLVKALEPEGVSGVTLAGLCDKEQISGAKGKRLNITTEVDGYSEDVLNRVCSREDVTVRELYKPSTTISGNDIPKVIAACNHNSKLKITASGGQRRALIIELNESISADKRDARLFHKIVTNELDALFWYVIEGLKRVLTRLECGYLFEIPQIVKDRAMNEAILSNPLTEWIELNYQQDPIITTSANELLKEFNQYCKDLGQKTITPKMFANLLAELKVKKAPRGSKGNRYYLKKVS